LRSRSTAFSKLRCLTQTLQQGFSTAVPVNLPARSPGMSLQRLVVEACVEPAETGAAGFDTSYGLLNRRRPYPKPSLKQSPDFGKETAHGHPWHRPPHLHRTPTPLRYGDDVRALQCRRAKCARQRRCRSLHITPVVSYKLNSCFLCKNFSTTETTEITEIFKRFFSVDSVPSVVKSFPACPG